VTGTPQIAQIAPMPGTHHRGGVNSALSGAILCRLNDDARLDLPARSRSGFAQAKAGSRAASHDAPGGNGGNPEIGKAVENTASDASVTAPPQMARMARMAPISPDWRHLAESFCSLGATEQQLAGLFRVSEEAIVAWMAEIPDFADAVRRGRNLADAHVANSLYRLAVGYSHTVERYMRGRDGPVKVSYLKHYPPHSKSCITWLENRRPQDWSCAAVKRKLQEWEDARDAAARRPPFLSDAALAALVLARKEESSALDQGPAVDPVGAGQRQFVDERYRAGMGASRTVVERVAAQGVLGWFGSADENHEPVLVAAPDVAGVVPAFDQALGCVGVAAPAALPMHHQERHPAMANDGDCAAETAGTAQTGKSSVKWASDGWRDLRCELAQTAETKLRLPRRPFAAFGPPEHRSSL
jgi:hypothetical protein